MPSENEAFVHPKTGNIVLPRGRILWNSVFQRRKGKAGKEGSYEFNLLHPKGQNLKVLETALLDAGKEKFPKLFADAKGKWPQSVKTPFKRTDSYDKLVVSLEEAGLKVEDFPFYSAARSPKDRPGIVWPSGKTEVEVEGTMRSVQQEDVYTGRWARMTVDCYGWEVDGNKMVNMGLKNIQLLDNDDELVVGGGRVSAESEFEAGASEGESSDSVFA